MTAEDTASRRTHDDVIEFDPAAFTTKQLRDAIDKREGAPVIPPTIAVKLLRKKLGRRAAGELAERAASGELPLRIRHQAISELAQLRGDAIPRLLEGLLDLEEDNIARSALIALRTAGDRRTITALQRSDLPDSLASIKQMTSLLIGIREGVDTASQLSRHDRDPIGIDPDRAEEVSVRRPKPVDLEEAIAVIKDLDVAVAPQASIEFVCGAKSLIFVPTSADFLGEVPKGVTVVGVVAGYDRVESQRWRPELFAVVDARESRRRPEIHLRTDTGRIVYSGTYDVETGEFSVAAESGPGATPIEAVGRYAAGEVTMERTRTGTRSRRGIRLDP